MSTSTKSNQSVDLWVLLRKVPQEKNEYSSPNSAGTNYYPGQKNRYSREIHEADLQFVVQIEVDVAWYQMIALRINLMNISAVTIFLARVV